jgi:hypothetical protein
MGYMLNAYRLLVGKPVRKSTLERSGCGWKDNIKMGCRGIGRGVDWINLA